MRDIRVATVQFQPAAGDKAYNFGRVRHFVTEAARAARGGARVELIAFPEMCLTGYWHVRKLSRAAFEALAEPVPGGPSTRDLLDLSREHGMTIGGGLLERAPRARRMARGGDDRIMLRVRRDRQGLRTLSRPTLAAPAGPAAATLTSPG